MKHSYRISGRKLFQNFAWVLLLPWLVGCETDPEPTINQLLTGRSTEGKAWHLKTVLVNGEPDEDPCERDDLYIFKQDKSLEHRGGTLTIKPQFLKCFLGEGEEYLDWFYGGSSDKHIYVEIFEDGILQIVQYEITKINQNRLELTRTYEFPYGDKVEVTNMEFEYRP